MTSSGMLELFYGSKVYHKEPNWFYMGGTRYPADDQYAYQSVDPQYYAGAYPMQQTRYMSPVIEIRCCKECEYRLRNFIRRLPGVDSVMSDRYHEKMVVFGSANPEVVRQAVRHAKNHYPGHHHHNSFWPRILSNAFRRFSFGSLYDMHYYNYTRHAAAPPSWRYGPRKLVYGPDSYGAGRGASHCSPYQPYNNYYNANGNIYY